MIAVTARIARFFGHSEDHTTTTIQRFSRELPVQVHPCSSRLIKHDWKEIDRCITKQVEKVYSDKAAQPDAEESNNKLHAAITAWSNRGLDILDKATWDKTGLPKSIIILNEEDQQAVNTWLAPALGPAKYQGLACDVAVFMARLADHKMHCSVKDVRHRAMSYPYWQKVLEDRFGIKLGNKNKVANLLRTAQELGIIKPWCGGSKSLKRATIYEVGKRMKKYMEKQGAQDAIENGSILFEYHFCEDSVNNADMNEQIKALLGEDVLMEAAMVGG